MTGQGSGQEVKQICKLRPHIQSGFGKGNQSIEGWTVFTFEVYHMFC